MDNSIADILLELYKSHHNAKEASCIVNLPYPTVANVYRGFKAIKVKKYNRVELIRHYSNNDQVKGVIDAFLAA
jgi:hypothetical protein